MSSLGKVSYWKRLDEAFGKAVIPELEKQLTLKTFDILSPSETIKPRQVINFVNELVALYQQWEKEVKSGDIKFRFLALFALTKKSITKSPFKSIINRDYLSNVKALYENEEDLDTCISALTFGVDKNIADEVLLQRNLKRAIRKGDIELIRQSTKHNAFSNYFYKAYEEVEYGEKMNHVTKIVELTKSVLPENIIHSFWNSFADNIVKFDEQFEEFNENHKSLILNTSTIKSKKILQKLVAVQKINIGEESSKYYNTLHEIKKFMNEKNSNINIQDITSEVMFEPEDYLFYIDDFGNKYKEFNISCNIEELQDFFFEDDVIDVNKIKKWNHCLVFLKDDYSFKRIITSMMNEIESIPHTQTENLAIYLEVLKKLSDKPLKLKLSNSFYAQLSKASLDIDEVNVDAICIALSNFELAYTSSGNFQATIKNLSPENVNSICEKIEFYITYDNFLKLIVSDSRAQTSGIRSIANNITIGSYGSSQLDINWVLKNFSEIITNTFDDDEKKEVQFVNRINDWHIDDDTNIEDIDVAIFKHLDLQELELIKKISEKAVTYINNLSQGDLLTSFVEKNDNFSIIESLINNSLIASFSTEFHSAFDSYFKSIAKNENEDSNCDFWDNVIGILDSRKLKSTFTSIRDILINDRGDVSSKEIYFLEKGLFYHGNLIQKPEGTTLNIILPIIDSTVDAHFKQFLKSYEILVPIIEKSSEHKETVIGKLEVIENTGKYRDNEKFKKVLILLGIKSSVKEE